jgi:hypothetical protein
VSFDVLQLVARQLLQFQFVFYECSRVVTESRNSRLEEVGLVSGEVGDGEVG